MHGSIDISASTLTSLIAGDIRRNGEEVLTEYVQTSANFFLKNSNCLCRGEYLDLLLFKHGGLMIVHSLIFRFKTDTISEQVSSMDFIQFMKI